MISIDTFTLASDFQSVNVVIDAGVGETVDELYFYIGSNYLTATSVDLSARLSGIQQEDLTITKGELGITDDVIDGILTVYTVASDTTEVESSIYNSYYDSLILARKIATESMEESFQEIQVIYFLIEATKTYIASGFTEQALNTLERVTAMIENHPDYMLIEDLPECEVGSGCWIINGKYVIN